MKEKPSQRSYSYEEYSVTSKNYNTTRSPVGIDFIVSKIISLGRNVDSLSVLDAGCGTGNYIRAIKSRIPGLNVTGIEANEGMLNVARQNTAYLQHIDLRLGSILNMEQFQDNTFDIVLVNQVLHHLTDINNRENPYHRIKKAFAEISRVLKPNGLLIVNTCSHAQMQYGFWYASLIPKTVQRYLAHLCPIGVLQNLMEMQKISTLIAISSSELLQALPVDLERGTLTPHLDRSKSSPDGPLTQAYRDGDSIWALISSEEKAHIQQTLASMDDRQMVAFFKTQKNKSDELGQTTFIVGEKKAEQKEGTILSRL